MPALGITGGIATGKSTFTAAIRRWLPGRYFDADQCSRELLARNSTVREAVRASFGPQAFAASGEVNRTWLRDFVFADEMRRHSLESILHPAIRASWAEQAARAATSDEWFCVDIPLLFENKTAAQFNAIVVVGCSAATQATRLREHRRLTDALAGKILAAQLDLGSKITQADYLIWNDFSESCLERQARLLADSLRKQHS